MIKVGLQNHFGPPQISLETAIDATIGNQKNQKYEVKISHKEKTLII